MMYGPGREFRTVRNRVTVLIGPFTPGNRGKMSTTLTPSLFVSSDGSQFTGRPQVDVKDLRFEKVRHECKVGPTRVQEVGE